MGRVRLAVEAGEFGLWGLGSYSGSSRGVPGVGVGFGFRGRKVGSIVMYIVARLSL